MKRLKKTTFIFSAAFLWVLSACAPQSNQDKARVSFEFTEGQLESGLSASQAATALPSNLCYMIHVNSPRMQIAKRKLLGFETQPSCLVEPLNVGHMKGSFKAGAETIVEVLPAKKVRFEIIAISPKDDGSCPLISLKTEKQSDAASPEDYYEQQLFKSAEKFDPDVDSAYTVYAAETEIILGDNIVKMEAVAKEDGSPYAIGKNFWNTARNRIYKNCDEMPPEDGDGGVDPNASVPSVAAFAPASFNEDTESIITLPYSNEDGPNASSCSISNLSDVTESTACSCDGGGVCTVGVTGIANHNGAASFDFKVTTPGGESVAAVASLTIDPVNDVPVATPQSLSMSEDGSLAITLSGSDADPDTLTYTVLSSPSNGALTGTLPTLTYTPDGNFYGSDSFTFKVNDGSTDSGAATISINVTNVNDAPVLSSSSAPANITAGVEGSFQYTYTDVDGDTSMSCIVSDLSNLSVNTDCTCASGNCSVGVMSTTAGPGSFSFKIQDASFGSSAVISESTTIDPGAPTAITAGPGLSETEGTAFSAVFSLKDTYGNYVTDPNGPMMTLDGTLYDDSACTNISGTVSADSLAVSVVGGSSNHTNITITLGAGVPDTTHYLSLDYNASAVTDCIPVYVASAAVASITKISPKFLPESTGGYWIYVEGAGFTASDIVRINDGVPNACTSTIFVDSTALICQLAPSLSAGVHTLEVFDSATVVATTAIEYLAPDSMTSSTWAPGGDGVTFPLSPTANVSAQSVTNRSSGKWYYEYTRTASSYHRIGFSNASLNDTEILGVNANSWAYNSWGGDIIHNATTNAGWGSNWQSFNAAAALDLNAGFEKIIFISNGVFQGNAYSLLGGSYHVAISNEGAQQVSGTINFGSQPMSQSGAAPRGFIAWNGQRLKNGWEPYEHGSDATVSNSGSYGVAQAVSGGSTSPWTARAKRGPITGVGIPPNSGIWYWEVKTSIITGPNCAIGIANDTANLEMRLGSDAGTWALLKDDSLFSNGTPGTTNAADNSWIANDVISVVYDSNGADVGSGKIRFKVGGTDVEDAAAWSYTNVSGWVYPAVGGGSGGICKFESNYSDASVLNNTGADQTFDY